MDFSDTTEWWVFPEGIPWRVALNGKNKAHCLNVVTGEYCHYVELIQKTHHLTQEEVVERIGKILGVNLFKDEPEG